MNHMKLEVVHESVVVVADRDRCVKPVSIIGLRRILLVEAR